MANALSPIEKHHLVTFFTEIASGESNNTALRFLQATKWNLEDAIQLFYEQNESGREASTSYYPRTTTVDYQMHPGSFEHAKIAASAQDKWLIVNLLSVKEFNCHNVNQDAWANEAVAQTLENNFIFWQIYEDTIEGMKVCSHYKVDKFPAVLVIDPITGQKMHSCSALQPEKLLEDLVPFLEDSPKDHLASRAHKRPRKLTWNSSPKSTDQNYKAVEEIQQALAEVSMESMENHIEVASKDEKLSDTNNEEETVASEKKPVYPHLPEEPLGDKKILCRVGIRLPCGRKVQRNFLKTDPIQLLWSFCSSLLREEDESRTFRFIHAIPGASKSLDYGSSITFEDSGLSNSMLSLIWE